MQAYSDPKRESDPHALPDIEIFELLKSNGEDGWYWWSCFPGCLPDGEPCGPFESADAALADVRQFLEVSE